MMLPPSRSLQVLIGIANELHECSEPPQAAKAGFCCLHSTPTAANAANMLAVAASRCGAGQGARRGLGVTSAPPLPAAS